LNDDTMALLLSSHRYPDIDMPFAVEQIEARTRLKTKLPTWYAQADLIMGGRVPAEQCSSEQTAKYKKSIINSIDVDGESIIANKSLCDMTGGMGVDFWYLSEGMKRAVYTERNEWLCEVARHNFPILSAVGHEPSKTPSPQIEIRQGDGRELPIPSVDVIYLDPARRSSDGSRVYAMEDCEPNIVEWQDELLSHARLVLVKLSPMVDLTDVLRKLKCVTDVYVVGVKNECKEVLVKMCASMLQDHQEKITIHCVDFLSKGKIEYSYCLSDEIAISLTNDGVQTYLYEPDVTLMKARAFNSLCSLYSLHQLDVDTHLMTSDQLMADFPGRIFEVEEQIPFSSKILKRLKKTCPQANIATRNFPLTADELRKRTGIKDGGEVYLFGAKVKEQGAMLLKCRKKTLPLQHETF